MGKSIFSNNCFIGLNGHAHTIGNQFAGLSQEFGVNISIVLVLKSLFYDPLTHLQPGQLVATYTIDIDRHYDFFIVTVSRLWYYCGVSVQTFFLYFLQDIIHVQDDPESAVAYLAVLGQISGSLLCYPVGWLSDTVYGGRRKPFVYLACSILGCVVVWMMFATSMHQMVILGQ